MSCDATNKSVVTTYSNRRNDVISKIVGFCACSTIIGTISLTAPFVLCQIKSPLPYMATPSRKIIAALEVVIRRKRRLNGTEHTSRTFVDFGSGDGEAVYQAVKLGYTHAIGIEFNWTLYCLSQLRRNLFWSVDERRRSLFYWQDMFDVSREILTHSDTIMIFGVPSVMERLSITFAKACRPGTHVIAYRFPLPIRQIDSNLSNNCATLLDATLIYDEDEIRVYECNSVHC